MEDNDKKPETHQGDLDNLPAALAPLKAQPQWAGWKWTKNGSGDWQKPPYQSVAPDRFASVTDPSTWSTYEVAVARWQAGDFDGISYILTPQDELAAVDLDDCLTVLSNGGYDIAPWALHFLDNGKLGYAEVTPSAKGGRIWGLASGATVNRKFTNVDGNGAAAELFRKTNKALTITGLQINDVHELGNIDRLIDWAEKWGSQQKQKQAEERARGAGNGSNYSGGRYSIDEIDQIVREGAPAGANRSNVFHSVVGHFIGCGWTIDEIVELLEKHPQGIGARYINEGRLRGGHGRLGEVERSAKAFGGERQQEEEPAAAGDGARADPDPENDWSKDAFTAAELKDMEFDPINVVVEGVIVEGLSLLAGKPKEGKSWMGLEIGVAATTNDTALGSRAVAQGDVLYLALEDSKRRLQGRLKKYLGGKAWPHRLTIKTSWRRLHEGGLEDLRAWHAATKAKGGKPVLIVVDVLAKVRKPIANQQIYEADYAALAGLQELAMELGVAILAILHTRKMQADDLIDMVSGSYGTTGAADTIIVLGRRPAGRVMDIRGREVEPNEFAVVFDEPTCRWSIRGDAAEIHMGDQRAEILGVLVEDGQPMKAAEIAEAAGIGRTSVNTVLMRMASEGQIQRVKRGDLCTQGVGSPFGWGPK